MSVPMRQVARVGAYVVKQHALGRKRYPLVLMLEPLFRCNLACSGCGKIDYPAPILNQRLSVADALAAADECGAPVVSIAGGEPLLHKEMPEIVRGLLARKKFIYLCTNALLLEKKMDDYTPHPDFSWDVHLDGDREMHDRAVSQEGTYDRAVAAIKEAKRRGFRVSINCTLFDGAQPERVGKFFDDVMAMGVDGIMTSPGYAYERAPDQAHFLSRQKTKQLFRDILTYGKGKGWKFTQSPAVHELPGRQRELHLHPLGQADPQRVRLAAPLLPARRGLHQDLQGADGQHRLGQVRHRQLREVRGLHGPLGLREHGRHGRREVPGEDHDDRAARPEADRGRWRPKLT